MSHFKPEYCVPIYPGMPQPKPYSYEKDSQATLIESRLAGLNSDQLKEIALLAVRKIFQKKIQRRQS